MFLGPSWYEDFYYLFYVVFFVCFFCFFFFGGGGGHHKSGLVLGVISLHFMVFYKVKVQNENVFEGLLKFQVFFGGRTQYTQTGN